jgi:hypothetical protein
MSMQGGLIEPPKFELEPKLVVRFLCRIAPCDIHIGLPEGSESKTAFEFN